MVKHKQYAPDNVSEKQQKHSLKILHRSSQEMGNLSSEMVWNTAFLQVCSIKWITSSKKKKKSQSNNPHRTVPEQPR